MLRRLAAALTIVAAITVAPPACRRDRTPAIVVEDRVVRIHNQTGDPWSDVRVWLNDHYLAGTPVLEPNGRFMVQQRDFIAAMGQRYDPARQSPYGVLLTAKSEAGEVRLVWGKPYRK